MSFVNNGREVLRASSAKDLRERAYQIFGQEFLDNLLEVKGGHDQVARVTGYVSAPRDRRTSRDSQYLFVNRRYVRDRMIGRSLSEGYRSILPHGVYPAALLFIETPLEEVDVNVHPAKTEVRFRRQAAVSDAVREAVRLALASAGYVRPEDREIPVATSDDRMQTATATAGVGGSEVPEPIVRSNTDFNLTAQQSHVQPRIEFVPTPPQREEMFSTEFEVSGDEIARDVDAMLHAVKSVRLQSRGEMEQFGWSEPFPPLNSADKFARQVTPESLSSNIRPLGQQMRVSSLRLTTKAFC